MNGIAILDSYCDGFSYVVEKKRNSPWELGGEFYSGRTFLLLVLLMMVADVLAALLS